MKKFVIAMIVVLLAGAVMVGVGCAVIGANGGFEALGKQVSMTERVYESEKPFDKLNLDLYSPHKYVFVRGDGYSVKYSDSEERPISVSVTDAGVLKMNETKKHWFNWFWKQATSVVEITVPENVVLSIDANLSGTSEIEFPSWKFGSVELDLSGASNLHGTAVDIGVLDLELSGASEIRLTGKVATMKIEMSGASKITCTDFDCNDIDVDASGTCKINLAGTGNKLDFDASGSGDLKAKDFQLTRAEIDISGSVEAEVSVSEFLSVESSGSATVKYWGNPHVENSGSGSSSVRKMD